MLILFRWIMKKNKIKELEILFFILRKENWLGRCFSKVCGRNIPPVWYVNSQLRDMYQPSFFVVPPLRSGEPVASERLYLLDNPSHVKDDKVDILQAVDAFAPRGVRFVKHPNKFELLHLMVLTCQRSFLIGGLPKH